MTTKSSPLRELKAQADLVARMMKAFERGEEIDPQFAAQMKAARARETVKFGLAMDDKIITIDMPWALIRSTGEVALSEWILGHMREQRETLQ